MGGRSGRGQLGLDPPPGRGIKTSIIDSANSKLSSYDPVSAGLDANSQIRRNSEYLRNRTDQLQRQLDGLNYARQRFAEAAEQAKRRKLEQCQRQRGVDCDDDYEEIGYPRVTLVSRQALLPVPFGSCCGSKHHAFQPPRGSAPGRDSPPSLGCLPRGGLGAHPSGGGQASAHEPVNIKNLF